MDSEKPTVDEKTARLMEEMDKSLHNMEKSLGIDHPVVSKILDSYAKLLRQNNIRHLDALNMEARAKAIRAKHNIKEAEQQAKGLESSTVEKRGISAGQLRFLVWVVSICILVGLSISANDLMRMSAQQIRKKSSGIKQAPLDLASKPLLAGDTSAGTSSEEQDKVVETSEEKDPTTGEVTKTTKTTYTSPQRQLNLFEVAQQVLRIKKLAKEQLVIGRDAEKNKDIKSATEAYVAVVKEVQAAPGLIGRQVYSEEIAACLEGYARMAELQSHPEIAREWEQAAADVRSHISD